MQFIQTGNSKPLTIYNKNTPNGGFQCINFLLPFLFNHGQVHIIMDIKATDVCKVHGFRLTGYKVFNGDDIVNTYFNIRDEQGTVHGRKYDDVETPLKIMLSMLTTEELSPLSV